MHLVEPIGGGYRLFRPMHPLQSLLRRGPSSSLRSSVRSTPRSSIGIVAASALALFGAVITHSSPSLAQSSDAGAASSGKPIVVQPELAEYVGPIYPKEAEAEMAGEA